MSWGETSHYFSHYNAVVLNLVSFVTSIFFETSVKILNVVDLIVIFILLN